MCFSLLIVLEIASNFVYQMFATARARCWNAEEAKKRAGIEGNKTRENIYINCRNYLTSALFEGEQNRKARIRKTERPCVRFVFDISLTKRDRSRRGVARRYFRLMKPLRKLFLSLDLLRVYPIVASCKARLVGVRSFSPVHPMKAVYRFLSRITMLPFPASLW